MGIPLINPPVPPPETASNVTFPGLGEVITSLMTGNTYTMGERIGEGSFGVVFSCTDVWRNDLAAKVLKPVAPYETLKAHAESEFVKLLHLRNPFITFVYDAFEFRNTFFIITERCHCPVASLFALENFDGRHWIMPIARCLLQAIHYLHLNQFVHQDIHGGNVFAAFAKDEIFPEDQQKESLHFKLGDLGVAKLFTEVNAQNTRAQWMLPPEVLNSQEFGPLDWHIDIYHASLLLLQFAYSRELPFTREEILVGRPRELALSLPSPFNVALEKALRRHVAFRTADAMELWRDLHIPAGAGGPNAEPGRT